MGDRVRANADDSAERLDARQEPSLILAIRHHDSAWHMTHGLLRPDFQLRSALTGTIIVGIQQDQDTPTVRCECRDLNGALQPVLLYKLVTLTAMRSRNLDVPCFRYHRQLAQQDRSGQCVTLAFDDWLDDHQTLSNNWGRGRLAPSLDAGSSALARNNSPAPIRCCCRAVRLASETEVMSVAPSRQSTRRR